MSRYDPKWTVDYYRRLHERLSALPGVESHAFAVVPVLENDEWDNWVTIEGYSAKQDERPDPHMQFCSPGFFKTLKIPVLLGRDFNERDITGAPKVGIVNQKFVKRYFGSANPLGRHIGMGIDPGTKTDIEIVGVVGDTKYESMRDEIPYELYLPSEQQRFQNGVTVYVRAAGDPAHMFNALRPEVRAVDASVPMYDMRTLTDQIGNLSAHRAAVGRAFERLRMPRHAAGRPGTLWRDGFHGGAPHPRDRHSDGAGRGARARWCGWFSAKR